MPTIFTGTNLVAAQSIQPTIPGLLDSLPSSPPTELKSEPALRYDLGKLRYDLVPPDGLEELVKVYTMGAQKYADRNWEKGMSWSRCFGSLLRHAFKWWAGEDKDSESGLSHMAHVAWNAIALLTYSLRKVGTDDRVRLPTASPQA